MKKTGYRQIIFLSILLLNGLLGCQNATNDNIVRRFIEEKKTSVNWKNTEEDIIDFSANVKVYSMNNRKDSSMKYDSSYRISTKMIQGEQYTRLDMLNEGTGKDFVSVISNEKEMVVFDSLSQEIKYRLPVDKTAKDFVFLQNDIGISSVNLDKIKTEAKRLSFDVTENKENATLIISLPNNVFSSNSAQRLSTKVMYDTTSQTLTNMETIDYRNNGSTVKTSIEFVYQECDGKYIKVGMISKIETEFDDYLEGVDPNLSYYNSIDEIPEISESDYKKMKDQGNIFEDSSLKFGNPADLSSSETIVEVYENIEINQTDDSVFKLLF